MQNDISKEFSLGGLLRFTFPTIIMMMFVATYIIADGIFFPVLWERQPFPLSISCIPSSTSCWV